MKSVLHIALIAPNYTNTGLMNGFWAQGFSSYFLFDFQLKMYEFGKEVMRTMLIQEAERLKPDFIFCQIQGSDILDTETFKKLSQIAFTVNYTFDIRSKEQTEWLYNLAPVIGLICFSNQRDVDECKSRGYNNTMVLQSSIDMDVYKPDDRLQYRGGVVFIGNNFENTNHQFPLSVERREMVSFLQDNFTDTFRVYGNNWGNSKVTTQKEEIGIYQYALIAINHNNFNEELYSSDRIWRIMATGAMCLTKHFKGIEKLFVRHKHLDWWRNLDELHVLLTQYLQYPKTHYIAYKGMEHVRGNHNWECRIAEMLKFIGPIKKSIDTSSCIKAGAHVIDGSIPTPMDQHFDGRSCDCGKTLWTWEDCGCTNKEFQLRAKENI